MTEAMHSEGAGALGVADQAGALYAIELDGIRLHLSIVRDDGVRVRAYSWGGFGCVGGVGEVWTGTKAEADARILSGSQMMRGAVVVKLNP